MLSENCLKDPRLLKIAFEDSQAGFAKAFLPHYTSVDFAEWHRELFYDLRHESRLVYAAPREHAKSTAVGLIHVLWCIVYQKKNFILIVSDSVSQAEKFIASVQFELETNELLRLVYGDLIDRTQKWTDKTFITSTGIMVAASGNGSNLRGLRHRNFRPDLIIGDDLENDEHVLTAGQRNKTWNWLTKSFLNLGSKDTQIVIIGTVLHYASMLNRLLSPEFSEVWHQRKYRAITDGVPLWPEHWSVERLEEKRKEIGSAAFATEFLNEPAESEDSPVKPEYIRWVTAPPDLTPYDIVVAIDPAISEKETADYFAIGVAARHRASGKILALESYKTRCNITQQVQLIENYFDKYPKARVFRIESVAYQQALAQLITNLKAPPKNKYIPVKEFRPDKDKTRRLQAIVPFIERGDVDFVVSTAMQNTVQGLLQWGFTDHDDAEDALISAIEELIAYKPTPSLVRG